MRKRTWKRFLLRVALIGACSTAISAFYHYTIRANTATASLTLLLVVLAAATVWGLPEALLAAVGSMLCLDYYFMPPVPGFGIEEPQNWVAWCAFLITSLVVSELSARLKARATEATQRQREIERMYALSCSLMPGETAAEVAQRITGQIAGIFACSGVV